MREKTCTPTFLKALLQNLAMLQKNTKMAKNIPVLMELRFAKLQLVQDSPYERSNRAWLTPADPELVAAAAVSAVAVGAAVSVAGPVRCFEADVLLSARCCHGGRCCARREVHGCNLWESLSFVRVAHEIF